MPDKTWKAVERRLARRFGTERRGATGDNGPDFETDIFSVQIKHRKSLPQWIKDGLANALRAAQDSHFGLLILCEKHKPDDDALVVMRLTDWEELVGKAFVADQLDSWAEQHLCRGTADVVHQAAETLREIASEEGEK